MKIAQSLGKFTLFGGATYLAANLVETQRPHMIFGWFGGSSAKPTPATSPSPTTPTELYVWGNGIRTHRSEYVASFSNFEPTQVKSFDGLQVTNLQKILFGRGLEGGISAEGKVLVWNMRKKLSLAETEEEKDDKRTNLQALDVGCDNLKAGFTHDRLWLLKAGGEVHSYPIVLKAAAYGDSTELKVQIEGKQRHSLKDITDLTFGEMHTLALSKTGEVYCWGDDTLGQCGQGSKGRTTFGPFAEATESQFVQVKGKSG